MAEQLSLLEQLAHATHCTYLSDLHRPGLRAAVLKAAQTLSQGDFSPREWSDAVSYITGNEQQFLSAQAAIDYLNKESR